MLASNFLPHVVQKIGYHYTTSVLFPWMKKLLLKNEFSYIMKMMSGQGKAGFCKVRLIVVWHGPIITFFKKG